MAKKQNIKNRVQATAIVSTSVPEQAQEVKDTRVQRNIDYKPFGSDNLYPQALASLYRKSVGLRSIIKSKVTFTVSGGFTLDEEAGKATDFIDQVNSKGETLSEVYENYLTDRFFGGNSYLEIITDSKGSFINVEHVQSVKCRRHKNEKEIIIHPDWANYKKNDGLTTVLPMFPKFVRDGKFKRSIVHVMDYEPDFDWYGVPNYITAMDSAAIGYKTNKWNVSRLDNAFQTSGVLVVDGNMSDEDAAQLKKEFNDEMTGEGNQGKVMLIIKKLGGEGTEFTPINNNTEGDWLQLHTQSDSDLILANNWKKSLVGMSENTGFDVDRILNDYQVMDSTFLTKEQNKFIKLIKRVTFTTANLELEGLSIVKKPPISLLTKLNADKFTYIWEARKEAGLEYDAEAQDQKGFIDNTGVSTPIETETE